MNHNFLFFLLKLLLILVSLEFGRRLELSDVHGILISDVPQLLFQFHVLFNLHMNFLQKAVVAAEILNESVILSLLHHILLLGFILHISSSLSPGLDVLNLLHQNFKGGRHGIGGQLVGDDTDLFVNLFEVGVIVLNRRLNLLDLARYWGFLLTL